MMGSVAHKGEEGQALAEAAAENQIHSPLEGKLEGLAGGLLHTWDTVHFLVCITLQKRWVTQFTAPCVKMLL